MTYPPSFDTRTLWDLARVGRPVASADGAVIVLPVTTSPTGVATTRLWRIRHDERPVAVTDATTSASDPALSPSGRRLAFVRTVEGTRQVVVTDPDHDADADADGAAGDGEVVTALPLGVIGSPRWVDEHRLLVVTTLWADDPRPAATSAWAQRRAAGLRVHATERRISRIWDTWYEDDATQHVLLVDTADPDADPVDLTPGEWLLPDPLDDPGARLLVTGQRLAFVTAPAVGDEDGVPVPHLHAVGLGGGEVVDLTPDAPGPVGPPVLLPDGRVAVTIARERDFYAAPRDLWAIEPASGEHELLIGDADHGLDDVRVADDGSLVVATQLDTRRRLLRVVDGTTTPLGGDHEGSLAHPVPVRGGVLAIASSLTEPPELVLVDDEGTTRLTGFARPFVAEHDLGTVTQRTVPGARGEPVRMLLVHPPTTAVGDEPPPLVHLVHGGPHAAFVDEWHWRWNAARVAAEGWVVALVNFHGSTGFGHDFTRSIHGDWPTLPSQDVLLATDDLVADGLVDPDRMAIAGGSYGGYLVTWLCTVTDRFAAAVAHAAVTDVVGMYASDHGAGFDDAFGGRPWEDPTVLTRSPSSRYDRLSTPMLVVHGDRDLRVPIDQGRSLYGALQAAGIESRLVVFPDEHHWVLDRAASERWYDEVITWLHRFLDV